MREAKPAQSARQATWPLSWATRKQLLVAAVLFHLVVTVTIYGLGRYRLLPGTFDTNGIAVSFAPDGIELQEEAAALGSNLARGQIRDWMLARSTFHIKLYSICIAVLGSLLGPNILSAEPFNALCYLAILVLTFKLGEEVFSRRSGLIAAAAVGLWPTLLLHTTQLLKDPLFIVGMLAFFLVNLRLLSKDFSWVKAILTGAIGGMIALFIWLTRDSMGDVSTATATLGMALLIARQCWEKRWNPANLAGMAILIFLSAGVTRVVPKFHPPDTTRDSAQQDLNATAPKRVEESSLNPLSHIAARVARLRKRFILEYPDAGSNIDSDVQLNGTTDLIRYLPRAATIGFFAPFPEMWFASGNNVGAAGRRLSGLETIALYLVEVLAIVGLWRRRRSFAVWWIWLVAATGIISLGMVVVNVGALYRLRYVFVILLIILAAEGIEHMLEQFRKVGSNTPRQAIGATACSAAEPPADYTSATG